MPSQQTPRSPIRVFIVDDHAVVRIGLKTILADDSRLAVVGEAATAAECLRKMPEQAPAVVLLDLRLPDMEGCELCGRIKNQPQPPAVLVLTSFADDQSVLAAISAGADGYLLKDFDQTDLAESIVRVADGGSVLDPTIARKVIIASRAERPTTSRPRFASPFERLSNQECRVLELLAQGLSNKEIASRLNLGDGTVRNYLSAIFIKLEVKSRTEAMALWLRRR